PPTRAPRAGSPQLRSDLGTRPPQLPQRRPAWSSPRPHPGRVQPTNLPVGVQPGPTEDLRGQLASDRCDRRALLAHDLRIVRRPRRLGEVDGSLLKPNRVADPLQVVQGGELDEHLALALAEL